MDTELDNNANHRHPTWNRDELIIALAAYVQWDGNPPAKNSNGITDLSHFLNILHQSLGTASHQTLRNANGVYMKIMNFRRFDPKYSSQGKKGLSRGGRLEKEIWNTFHHDPARLQKTAELIRRTLQEITNPAEGANILPAINEDIEHNFEEAAEGRILSVLHFRRERSPKLVKTKKEQALRLTGKLACEVCQFDFQEIFGERGKGFIECHHTKPLESLNGHTKTHINDLALLCANCHRMIHAQRPWLTIAGLKSIRRPQS